MYDGAGEPVPDALLEIWQADADGDVAAARRARCTATAGPSPASAGPPSTPAGHYSFTTVRPGPTEDGAAPFFAMTVFARGLLNRLFTRVYLPDDEAALAADPLLDVAARGPARHPGRAPPTRTATRFDVRLQGDGETVFLAFPGS